MDTLPTTVEPGARERWRAILHTLGIFPGAWGATEMRIYEVALSDVPLAALEMAVAYAARTCRFRPTPAELRAWAGVPPPALPAPPQSPVEWTPCERTYVEFVWAWNREIPDAALSDAAQAVLAALGGWETVACGPPPTLSDWIAAFNGALADCEATHAD